MESPERKRPYYELQEDENGDPVAVVCLRRKYEAHGEQIDQIRIVEPTGKMMEAVDRAAGEQTKGFNHLLAATASVPYSTICKLKAADWRVCGEALAALGFTIADASLEES